MSSEQAVIEQDHTGAVHAHPGPSTYVLIGVILFFLTAIEVAIVYIPAIVAIMPLMVGLLMTLMVIKFALVVMFFMHLKFDNHLFAGLFTAPLMIAVSIGLALLVIFAYTRGVSGGAGEGPAPTTVETPAPSGH